MKNFLKAKIFFFFVRRQIRHSPRQPHTTPRHVQGAELRDPPAVPSRRAQDLRAHALLQVWRQLYEGNTTFNRFSIVRDNRTLPSNIFMARLGLYEGKILFLNFFI